jgi:F420H(2)-dependent quinone reductase
MDHLGAFGRVIGLKLIRFHTFLYRITRGYIGHKAPGGRLCLLLHTTGAKTGTPRTAALTYARDGRDFVVVASMAGSPRSPGWYHNLRAAPVAEINVGAERFVVRARTFTRGEGDYERLWSIVNDANGGRYQTYQGRTSRPIPVVVLTPEEFAPRAD